MGTTASPSPPSLFFFISVLPHVPPATLPSAAAPSIFSPLSVSSSSVSLSPHPYFVQPRSEAHPRHHRPTPNFDCLLLELSLFFLLCFFFSFHGLLYCRHRRPFLLGVRVRTMGTGMSFHAAPYWPHDTPCQLSSISTSVAHLWRHRPLGAGQSILLCHVRRRLVFSGELHCSFTCAAMRGSSVLMLCRLPWL